MRILFIGMIILGFAMLFVGIQGKPLTQSDKIDLYIWHDLGNNGDTWLNEVGAAYQKAYPEVVIHPVSFNTQQWLDKSIASLRANQSPDLLFNNYERLLKIEEQTGKLSDLRFEKESLEAQGVLESQKMPLLERDGKTLMIPVQEVQMAFGVRKSWMANIGAEPPRTWEEVVRLAERFTFEDPDRNGLQDTYGFALEASKPRDLIHMIDLFNFGSGGRHTVMNEKGELVLSQQPVNTVIKSLYQILREGKIVPKETIYYGFSEMYQVIEGGQAGIFRVGDWNVKKWDSVLEGDYEILPWPSFNGREGNVVIAGLRGAAVPENAPNREEARKFVEFLTSDIAQKSSFLLIGSCLTRNLEKVEALELSPHQRFFAKRGHEGVLYDFPETNVKHYSQLEQLLHQRLIEGIKENIEDIDYLLMTIETEMNERINPSKE